MAVNECSFIGNLGADPEVRTTQSGDKVASFRIAVSEKWKDRQTGERRERTEWVPIVVWGALADVVSSYARKGSKVFVRGQFQTRKWQDQSGNDRYTTEIVLRGFDAKLELLGDPREGGERQNDRPGASRDPAFDDEVPF